MLDRDVDNRGVVDREDANDLIGGNNGLLKKHHPFKTKSEEKFITNN